MTKYGRAHRPPPNSRECSDWYSQGSTFSRQGLHVGMDSREAIALMLSQNPLDLGGVSILHALGDEQ